MKHKGHLTKVDPTTGEVDPHQVWMVNNMILMSDDGFETSRSALGEVTVDGQTYYGLISELVLAGYIEGSKIVGGTIQIGEYIDANGNKKYAFEVDKDGNVIMNASNKIKGYATNAELEITADEIRGEVSSVKTNLEGEITKTNSLISQTASEIRTEVNETKTDLQGQITDTNSTITQTAQSIRSEVSAVSTNLQNNYSTTQEMNSAIKQSADAITSTVSTTYATIGQTKHYGTCSTAAGTAAKVVTCSGFTRYTGATISVKFTNANSVASPTLNVNSTGAATIRAYNAALTKDSKYNWSAQSVVSFVFDGTYWNISDAGALKQTETLSSTITQTAAAITAEVNRATDEEGKLSSRITQNATDITSKVSKGSIISTINQSAESVSISASKIKLEGLVTANNNFKILTDGSIETKNANVSGKITTSEGNIAGWNIVSGAIYKNQYDSASNKTYSAAVRSGTSNSSVAFALYEKAGKQTDGPSINNGWIYDFYVGYNGKLYAKNAEITGKVTASSGDIGGWTIKDGCLYSEGEAYIPPEETEMMDLLWHVSFPDKFPIASDKITLYDFDGDGKLTIEDVRIMYKVIKGSTNFKDCPNAKKAGKSKISVTVNPSDPAKTICVSGTNIWGRKAEYYIGADMSKSEIATKGFVSVLIDEFKTDNVKPLDTKTTSLEGRIGALENNKGSIDHLWSGSLSSGSCTFTYSTNYKYYIIQGAPASSTSRMSQVVPRSLITTTATDWQIADDANYVTFSLKYSGSTATLTWKKGSGIIYNVFGVK